MSTLTVTGFIADFYFPKFRAILEVDGDQHADSVEYDERRDGLFRGWGYSIFRIRSKLVLADPRLALELVEMFLEDAHGKGSCAGNWSSRPSLTWRFTDYGLLKRCFGYRCVAGHVVEHWFRVTDDMSPDTDILTFGSGVDETDYHGQTLCQHFSCA